MVKRNRRYGAGVLVVGALAGAALLTDGRTTPVTPSTIAAPPATANTAAPKASGQAARNLRVSPEKLVPRTVSAARPARIVTTTIGPGGRPVISVHTATDRAGALARVRHAQRAEGAVGVELDVPVRIAGLGTGTDPYRGYQWDLGAIGAPQAWSRTTGAGVTVAVLDSGVDATHPDLAGQVLPGADLTDGTVGPSHDVHGHGTHVAGTIAAATGNGTGVAGIAPDVKILPVRVLGDNGSGYMSVAAAGVVWAADHGADVINLSISGASPEQSMTTAIEYARSRGTVVVAAAGNDRQKGSPTSYPGAQPGVIAVAATDQADNVAPFSTAGGYVDIAAPGSGIVSTYPNSGYARMSGTSMAAPHVAAAAALVRSIDRSLTPDQVERVLESSSVDRGAPGRDDDFGHGRLDITAALAAVPAPPAPAQIPAAPAPSEPTPSQPTPSESAPSQPTPSQPTPSQPTPSESAPSAPAPSTPAPSESAPSTPAPSESAPSTAPTPEPTPTIEAGRARRYVKGSSVTTTTFTVTAAGRPVAGRRVDVCIAVGRTPFTCDSAVTAADGTVTINKLAVAPLRIRLILAEVGVTAEVAYELI